MNGNVPYILVTGATGGIGREVCKQLVGKHYRPIIAFRNAQPEAELLANECGGVTLPLDLSGDKSVDNAIEYLAGLGAQVAGVVHCASPVPKLASFGRITYEEMELFWRANVMGPQRLFAGMLKACFRFNKSGTVVAVTSRGMGETLEGAMPGLGAYTISKYGLCGVLALLASEYKWLKVQTVSPGFTQTKMLEVFDPRFLEQLAASGAVSNPADIANEIMAYF